MLNSCAVIVAGGLGRRFGNIPKQFQVFRGAPLLWHTLQCFENCPEIGKIALVLPEASRNIFSFNQKNLIVVAGGENRQQSVFNGLKALKEHNPDNVLIHDGARPFVSSDLIYRILEALKEHKAVIPVLPMRDTIKKVSENWVHQTVNRNELFGVQTPQGFAFDLIYELHRKHQDLNLSDDSALCEFNQIPVFCVEGESMNQKITFPNDLPKIPDIRVGHGFDVHAIIEGSPLMLFGCEVEANFRLLGHSDADVGLHSITDALLGAIGEGDIGLHFQPSDPQWKGKESSFFLDHALTLLQKRRGVIQNVDATLVGEQPRLSSYRHKMRERVAEILKIQVDRVSVKATTTEKLGFCGRKEGLAVLSTVTIALP